MTDLKNKIRIFQKKYLPFVGVFVLISIAIFLLWFNSITSMQARPSLLAQVYFEGEYRIGDGEWQPIIKGEHIPSTKGDVTLRGYFHMLTPDGEYIDIYREDLPIAFYTNHINLTFFEEGNDPFVMEMENPMYGKSSCGENWCAYILTGESEEPIEILVHNPHLYGNETAIDDMLSKVAIWANIDFEQSVLRSGELQKNIGMTLMLISIVFLGIALFSTLIHIRSNRFIWLLALMVLVAGFYFTYSSEGVSFWQESIVLNTTLLGCSIMFYMLFLSIGVSHFLRKTRKISEPAAYILGVAIGIFFIVSIVTDIRFYDTWIWWVAVQSIVNIVLSICMIKEFASITKKERCFCIGIFLQFIAFSADVVGIWIGAWHGAFCSQFVFAVLFAVAMFIVLRFIPYNINAATKAKELEMEKIILDAQLAESRISTMISQIRPHFIYNTLGSIEQLCKLDPPKASDLVHNFAKYLRGNFGELDNSKPILMSKEMEHVRYYVSIEKVRFPDMTFTFQMNSGDFHIPALTIQPIVENAIKHGLMKLPRGGTIHVDINETDKAYCISVVDDGVGFDTDAQIDDRKHVGLRNIRERLRAMVNGTLEIESKVGVGTKVRITIPKEV